MMIRPDSSERFLMFPMIVLITFVLTGAARAASLPDASAAYARGDDTVAAKRLVRLAARGNARAQGLLGFMYEYGRGVPQDYVLAAEWYIRGAEQGDPAAQYLLGLMYDKGRGVPQDAVLAHKWLILAAARAGHRDRDASIKLRDAVATKMSEAQIALAQYLAREWRPLRERQR
jgi:TPR repeat protein